MSTSSSSTSSSPAHGRTPPVRKASLPNGLGASTTSLGGLGPQTPKPQQLTLASSLEAGMDALTAKTTTAAATSSSASIPGVSGSSNNVAININTLINNRTSPVLERTTSKSSVKSTSSVHSTGSHRGGGGAGGTRVVPPIPTALSVTRLKPEDIVFKQKSRPKTLRGGQYLVGSILGQGSFAQVREAYDTKEKKLVAIKIFNVCIHHLSFSLLFLHFSIDCNRSSHLSWH